MVASESQQVKKDLELDFLEEYGSIISAKNNINRYFNTPSVKFILNEKENQV
jgi:hypothetical protein